MGCLSSPQSFKIALTTALVKEQRPGGHIWTTKARPPIHSQLSETWAHNAQENQSTGQLDQSDSFESEMRTTVKLGPLRQVQGEARWAWWQTKVKAMRKQEM